MKRIGIQYFADAGADNAQQTQTGEPAAAQKQEETKTFTQEDVNSIVARESKSAVEKLLKEAGISSESDYKSALKAFKKWQDSQKTELDKATESLSAAEKAKNEAEAKALLLERQLTAVKKGIPADKADKYIKLAEAYFDEKTSFEKALEKALKDFPVTQTTRASYVPPNPATTNSSTNLNRTMNDLIRSKR